MKNVAAGATAVASGVAGCLDGPSGGDGSREGTGYAAFFALWDWAEQVAGDEFDFENPVPVGQMGHGWDPPGDIVPEIASTAAFIYLDTPEFRWAQDVASQLRAEHESVAVIDGMNAIPSSELLLFDGTGTTDGPPDPDYEFDPDDFAVGEFEIIDARTGDVTAWWHDDHWHGGVPDVPLDDELSVALYAEDSRGRVLPLGADDVFQFDARIPDGAPDDVVEIESHGDRVELRGQRDAQTLLVFELKHDGTVVFDTSSDETVVSVVDADEVEVDVFYDPHVWVDPVLAQDVVDGIAAGLGEIDSDNASQYAEHAEQYTERIQDVHAQFEELTKHADHDVVIFAGHNSFRYFANRYDLEILTPTGVTPDAVESLEDVAGLARAIDDHGLDTVLYDPFEAPNPGRDLPAAVEVLIENSGAEQYAPLTPAEGTIPAWREEGYGWVEQMIEINLPSLELALNVD